MEMLNSMINQDKILAFLKYICLAQYLLINKILEAGSCVFEDFIVLAFYQVTIMLYEGQI